MHMTTQGEFIPTVLNGISGFAYDWDPGNTFQPNLEATL